MIALDENWNLPEVNYYEFPFIKAGGICTAVLVALGIAGWANRSFNSGVDGESSSNPGQVVVESSYNLEGRVSNPSRDNSSVQSSNQTQRGYVGDRVSPQETSLPGRGIISSTSTRRSNSDVNDLGDYFNDLRQRRDMALEYLFQKKNEAKRINMNELSLYDGINNRNAVDSTGDLLVGLLGLANRDYSREERIDRISDVARGVGDLAYQKKVSDVIDNQSDYLSSEIRDISEQIAYIQNRSNYSLENNVKDYHLDITIDSILADARTKSTYSSPVFTIENPSNSSSIRSRSSSGLITRRGSTSSTRPNLLHNNY